MSIDIFSPRTMTEALKHAKRPETFLQNTFFRQERAYRTENIDVDIQEKGRRVAPFVNKRGPAKFVERQGFETSSIAPPCIATKTVVSPEDVSVRVMGENIYEDRAPEQRAMELLADDLAEHRDMHARRKEMMCRDVIYNLDGDATKVLAIGDDTSLEFTFPRKPALQIGALTGGDRWDQAGSDPLNQIDVWAELYGKETGLAVTDIVYGATAYRTFANNAKVQAKMVNTSLIQSGQLAPNAVPKGARLVGTLAGGALRLWTYHSWYDDPDNAGTTTAMIPEKSVMLCSSEIRTEMRYGGLRDLTSQDQSGVPTIRAAVELPRSWVDMDPPTRFLELRSRPLPVPIQNWFLTATVQD